MATFIVIILIAWEILSWVLEKLGLLFSILFIPLYFFVGIQTLWKDSQAAGLIAALMVTLAVGMGYLIGKLSWLPSSLFYVVFLLVLVPILILIFTFKDKNK